MKSKLKKCLRPFLFTVRGALMGLEHMKPMTIFTKAIEKTAKI